MDRIFKNSTDKTGTRCFNSARILLVFALLASCSKMDEEQSSYPEDAQKAPVLCIKVSKNGWNETPVTRMSYGGFAESSESKTFSCTFQAGDAIGIFVVDKAGKVVVANHKFTFSDSSWDTETPVEYLPDMGGFSFFAYYPWESSLTGAPAKNSSVDGTSIDTFFGPAIAAWTPKEDQKVLADFTSSDLMMAKGTTSAPYFQEIQVSFTLSHQMGLLVTKDVLSYYRLGNPSETWTEPQHFTPNVPYPIDELRYFLAKPNIPTTLGTKTTTVGPGQVEQLFFTNGEPVE